MKISTEDAYKGLDGVDLKVINQELETTFHSDQKGEREMFIQFFLDKEGNIVLEIYWDNEVVKSLTFKNKGNLRVEDKKPVGRPSLGTTKKVSITLRDEEWAKIGDFIKRADIKQSKLLRTLIQEKFIKLIEENNFTLLDEYKNSHTKVNVECYCGHVFSICPSFYLRGYGCPYCSRRKEDHTNSLATQDSFLTKEWHPTKNGELTPKNVRPGSSKKVWWVCEKGHEWNAQISHRTGKKTSGCPYCANTKKNRTQIASEIVKKQLKIYMENGNFILEQINDFEQSFKREFIGQEGLLEGLEAYEDLSEYNLEVEPDLFVKIIKRIPK